MRLNPGGSSNDFAVLGNPVCEPLCAVQSLTRLGQHLDPGGILNPIFRRRFTPKRLAMRAKQPRGLRTGQARFNEGQTWWSGGPFHLKNYNLKKSSFHQRERDPAPEPLGGSMFSNIPPPGPCPYGWERGGRGWRPAAVAPGSGPNLTMAPTSTGDGDGMPRVEREILLSPLLYHQWKICFAANKKTKLAIAIPTASPIPSCAKTSSGVFSFIVTLPAGSPPALACHPFISA